MDTDTAASPTGSADTQVTASDNAGAEAQTQAGGSTEGTTTFTDDQGNDGIADLLPPLTEDVEVDYEGAKYKVPAPLKDALLRQSDYTQKTMALADERRQLETVQRQVQEAQQLSAAEIRAFAQLDALNSQLANFEGIDWTGLDHSDPEVQNAKGVRDELARQHQALSAQINGHLATKQARAQQQAAKEREEVDAAMSRKIKEWGPEKRKQFEDFAVAQGVPAHAVRDASAVEFNLIRLAMIGSQAETQRMAALKAAASAKPAHEVGTTGSGGFDPKTASMEQYAAQMRKEGRL